MRRFWFEGTPSRRVQRALPDGVSIEVSLLGAAEGGRRVLARVRGPKKARERAATRFLPGLRPREDDGTDLSQGYEGSVAADMDKEGPARSLWFPLLEAERRLFGATGCLLSMSVSADQVVMAGLNVEARRPEELTAHAARTLADVDLVDGDDLIVRTQLWDGPAAAADPERLKATEVETARVALRLGYYNQPRQTTMQGIAEALGITKSAVYHRINGLERKAVERLFQGNGTSDRPTKNGPNI